MDCREAERFVQLRLDEEIEIVDCAQLDQHLETCPHCRRRAEAEHWFQSNVCSKLREATATPTARPSDAMRERLIARLDEERDASKFPMARFVAAGLAVGMIGALAWGPSQRGTVDETVARHASSLPPEVHADDHDEAAVGRYLQQNLRYPVSVPRFAGAHQPVRLIGARLSSIRDQDVAYFIYDHRGARLSFFAYPPTLRAEQPSGFERRRVGDKDLFVGQQRGYNVVSWRDRDREFALVSDVDPGELVHLASAAQRP